MMFPELPKKEKVVEQLPVPEDALGYLRSVYQSPLEPTHVRLKAAQIAVEYERPRLAVTMAIDQNDFARRLEIAIARSGKVIEAEPVQALPIAEPQALRRRV